MTNISIFSQKLSMKYVFDKEGADQLNQYLKTLNPSKLFVLTDTQTQNYCLPVLKQLLNHEFTNVNFKNGDVHKNLETLQTIWQDLITHKADRKSIVLNLGGGVVTDIGGFAGATFKRGIKFIHVPTTLLGMVDAAIGGKNGVNFMHLKNQIGTIVQPEMIWIFPEFLKTLPEAEFDSGFAEMLKHGLISDANYWNELIKFHQNRSITQLPHLIKKSVTIKNEIIRIDPQEQNIRKLLNYGHTIGHGIESYLNYQAETSISHGHAVAIGMILEAYLSYKVNGLAFKSVEAIAKSINSIYPYLDFDNQAVKHIVSLLKHDKKNENGKILFVLLNRIGNAVYNIEVPDEDVFEAFTYYKNSRT